MSTPTSAQLPTTHPLINELASVKQQLTQYQKSAHQSAIQAQNARHELLALKEQCAGLRSSNTALREEADLLR